MNWVALDALPRLHETPLPVINVNPPRMTLEADDQAERRVRLIFEPYQAVRVITADCFDVPQGLMLSVPWPVFECLNSPLIAELKQILARTDVTATFMNDTRHFLIPLRDDFLEVVAREVKWEFVPKGESGAHNV